MLVKISKTEYQYKGRQIVLRPAELLQHTDRGGCGWYATVDGQVCDESRGSGNRKLALAFAQAMVDKAETCL